MLQRLLARETTTITGAALLIGAASLVSRILGVVRERLLVGNFGIGPELDAYYAAFQIPNIVYNLLILGTLSVAFIPIFVRLREEGADAAWKFASTILNLTAIVMGVLALVVFFGANIFSNLVVPGFSEPTRLLVAELTRILVLSIFLFSLSNVFGSVLNAQKRFLAVAVAPLLYNTAIIAGILLFRDVKMVAWAVVVGALLHLILQAVVAMACGWRFKLILQWKGKSAKEFYKLFFPRIWGIDITQISILVGTIIGSTLAIGSVALFNLATNIEIVPVAIFGYAFAIAAFPALTETLARGDRSSFAQIIGASARQIVFFLLPLGFMTIVLRAHVIRLIIGTEQLTWNDTRLAAAALGLFALSLFLQGLAPLLSRAFYAMKNTWIPVLVSGVAVFTNIVLAYGFLAVLAQNGVIVDMFIGLMRLEGVPDIRMLGLPLAFSFASFVQVFLLLVIFRKQFGAFGGRRVVDASIRMLIASLLAALATYLGLQAAEFFAESRTYVGLLVQAVVATSFGFSVYIFVALKLKTEEADIFVKSLRRKLLRITRPVGVGEGERL